MCVFICEAVKSFRMQSQNLRYPLNFRGLAAPICFNINCYSLNPASCGAGLQSSPNGRTKHESETHLSAARYQYLLRHLKQSTQSTSFFRSFVLCRDLQAGAVNPSRLVSVGVILLSPASTFRKASRGPAKQH